MRIADEYVAGTLPTHQSAEFEDHFFTCDTCRMLVLRTATTRDREYRRMRK
jgi:hypothetical protein